jgi:hypothetical protein
MALVASSRALDLRLHPTSEPRRGQICSLGATSVFSAERAEQRRQEPAGHAAVTPEVLGATVLYRRSWDMGAGTQHMDADVPGCQR